ncbi:MAG TPA: HAMP domain-containing sensor histidine kinase [Thermoanaerobaculia bacterium]|nr:HAMP domain-containing sensor histidine kinase [Thermoanaerobaculia bacterium]
MKRPSSTAALSAGLLVLVTLLAGVQWKTLYDVQGVELDVRYRRIENATWRFKTIFEREVAHLAQSMASPAGSPARAQEELDGRLARWRAGSRWPGLAASASLVDGSAGGAEPALPAAPPASFLVDASVQSITIPPAEPGAPAVVVLLDAAYMAGEMFPQIVRMVLAKPSFFDLEVAVTEAGTGRVVYSNLDIGHASELGPADRVLGLVREGAPATDVATVLPLLRPITTGGVRAGASLVPSSWEWEPTAADEAWFADYWSWLYYTGHWRLHMREGANPLVERAAAATRRRAATGFALLALLAAGGAVLVVTTRRSQRAAHQQIEQLARVSHELRTPLAVLAGVGDNLADGLVRGEGRVREYGQAVQKATRRLHELVENVLHLARRRAGAPRMEAQRIDVAALIEESLGAAGPSLREAEFTVERALPARELAVLGDPRALRSALLNLISNAVKYGREARWLRLAVEEDSGAEVRIVVEDRGPGIGADELSGLFRPYARGARAMAEETEGSGLGLAVVREVAEAHAGRVSVTTPAGGGTAFTLHLPLAGAG